MEDPHTTPRPPLARKLRETIRSRTAKRAGIGVLAAFALYALLGFLAAPPLIKSFAERNLAGQIHRPVTVGQVAFNPFTLRLDARDVHVGGRADGEDFVDVGELTVRLSWASLARFAPVVGEVRIAAPRVHLIRAADGRFNFDDLLEPPPAPAEPGNDHPLDLTVERLTVVDGAVSLADAATGSAAELGLKTLDLSLDDLSLVGAVPGVYSLAAEVASGGSVRAEGRFDLAAQWAELKLSVDALALPAIQPYLTAATPARVLGGTLRATLQARAEWAQAFGLTLGDGTLGLSDLRLGLPGASAAALSLADASAAIANLDLAARRLEVSRVAVSGLAVDAARGQDGALDLAALVPPESAPAQPQSAAWRYRVGEIALKDSRVTFADGTLSPPVKLAASSLSLTARNLSDDLAAAVPVTLAATLNGKGAVSLEGTATLDPLKLDLKLGGQGIDVTPFAPYATAELNARIDRAVLDATGDVVFEQDENGPRASYRGDLALADVRVTNRTTQAEFAGWRSLALEGLAARYDAARGADVDAARVVFANFYGHVLLDEQGRLHLRDILAKGDTGEADAAPSAMDSVPLDAAAPASGETPVRLHVGKLELREGQVTYTDNFITPHYTAELAAINGTIGAFGTDSRTPAPIDVGARLTANGPISIKGKVNPLAAEPSLDLRAVARDIELTNLTAYSMKYTGYPITKGKLNVNLHYRLAGDRLKADNRIFIDQLTFGARVENDTATDLPVQLAISLLKNARGQIDVDIPVAGSLNDPQFSISSLVWNAIGNLVRKAITAPFALLAQALGIGGGEELGYVAFAPGASELPPAARDKLDTIAGMLGEKPSIAIDLIGRADPEVDAPALRAAAVARAVKAQKLKDLAAQGRAADPAAVTVAGVEYERYLADAYRDIAKAGAGGAYPSTRSGMEDALAAQAEVGEDALRQLAQERAQAVRAYLGGKVAEKRMFVVAPKLTPEGIGDAGETTRVDFSLK